MNNALSSNTIFLTVEGIEGVGKTTAIQYIQHYLTTYQQAHIVTREPGGTRIAEELRRILLTSPTDEPITPQTELLLMFAGRSQHIDHVILPALQSSKWVVCDRFVDASYAYQGGGRQLPMEQIIALDRLVVQSLQPSCTILLDAPPEVGLMRAKNRSQYDRIEQEKIEFFERVRAVYLERAQRYSARFHVIDATESLEKVHHRIKLILDQLLRSETLQ